MIKRKPNGKFLIYIAIASATIFSPGPGVILTVTNSLAYNRQKTLLGILGISLGMLGVALISATSIGIIISMSEKIFLTVQVCGALYLIYLGLKMLFKSSSGLNLKELQNKEYRELSGFSIFRQGLLTSLLNPKPILFFMAVFPQFIAKEQSYTAQFLLLSLTFCFLVIVIHLCYAEFFKLAGKIFFKESKKDCIHSKNWRFDYVNFRCIAYHQVL